MQGRILAPDEKVGITCGGGVSCLTLDDITADHAGKYEVAIDNSFGKDRKTFSVAVEGWFQYLSYPHFVNNFLRTKNQNTSVFTELAEIK